MHHGRALRERFDKEVQWFNAAVPKRAVLEQPITFAPTYCYNHDGTRSTKRAPAWTDRVLFDELVARAWTDGATVHYESEVWGGDHHAVVLHISAK